MSLRSVSGQPLGIIAKALRHHNAVRALISDGAAAELVGVSRSYAQAIDSFSGVGPMLEVAERYGDALPTWLMRDLDRTRRQLVSTIDSGALPTDSAVLVTEMLRELEAEAEVLRDPALRWERSNG